LSEYYTIIYMKELRKTKQGLSEDIHSINSTGK